MGEGGAFPAAARVVAEWIAPEERSTAMGIINAGTAVGSVLAPPLIGVVLLHSGWRAVFFVAGMLGLAWVHLVDARLTVAIRRAVSSNTLDARDARPAAYASARSSASAACRRWSSPSS